MKLVVFIPAYNEAESISKVVKGIPRKLKGFKKVEVLVVNDGSTDKTAELAERAGAVVVSHSANEGLGEGFRTGLEAALNLDADVLVNIDADGQFNANDIPKLVDPILTGSADFVSSDRFTDANGIYSKPENMSVTKYWGNKQMARLISFLAGQKFTDVSCGFRAYSKKTMLMLNLTGKFTYTQESFLDLASKGVSIKLVPVKVKYFPDRKSKMASSILKYALKTSKIIIRTFRDYKPLMFFGALGLLPFLFGIGFSGYLLVHYFMRGSLTPYKSFGFVGIYLISLSLLLWIVGLFADMFVRMRINQEKILYFQKLQQYGK